MYMLIGSCTLLLCFEPMYLHVCTCIINIQLKQLGHSIDKVEYIVMGGTFMALDDEYKDYFVRNLHDALSGHTSSSVEEAVK